MVFFSKLLYYSICELILDWNVFVVSTAALLPVTLMLSLPLLLLLLLLVLLLLLPKLLLELNVKKHKKYLGLASKPLM